MFLKLSLRPLEYATTIKLVWFFVSITLELCISVPLFLTELEVQFGLEPMQHPIRVIAPAECCFDMLVFLFQ